ncbi:MAG: DNA primase [Chloroflexi bacterium]|nr:DNA primase [Chloroflexota bacterium]
MSVIDEVKQKIDIVDLVSGYATLQKAGRNFRALCPFHGEKTPSFFVFPERQSWHCFGSCGTGGDIFSFVMRKENVDFGEALRRLAERAGVQLAPVSPRVEEEKEEVLKLRQINLLAAQFFHNALVNTEEARPVRQYLEKRGVSTPSVEGFQLGYAPKGWDHLLNYLKGKGYPEKEVVAAGLAIERESGGRHDRFRYRLIFPIRDGKGNVAGFGGRSLDDTMPKYLNSPQTVIFDKSGLLYGLDRAGPAIRKADQAIIVEGYMDVIIAHQYTFSNVVASMGTALSEKHIFSLKKLTRNVVLALDPDTAGETATLRGLEVAAEAFDQKTVPVPSWDDSIRYERVLDAEIKVGVLPPGNDPDELIIKSSQEWEAVIKAAKPLTDYVFDVAASRYDLSSAAGKSKAAEYLLGVIDQIKEPIRRMHYLQKLARLVQVEEKSLEAIISRKSAAPFKKTGFQQGPAASPATPTTRGVVSRPLEAYCLAMLLRWPELREDAVELTPELFESSENRVIFEGWLASPDLDSVKERTIPSLREHLAGLLGRTFPASAPEERQKALKDCILQLRERYLKSLKVKESIVLAGPPGDDQPRIIENIKTNRELKELQEKRCIPRGKKTRG